MKNLTLEQPIRKGQQNQKNTNLTLVSDDPSSQHGSVKINNGNLINSNSDYHKFEQSGDEEEYANSNTDSANKVITKRITKKNTIGFE